MKASHCAVMLKRPEARCLPPVVASFHIREVFRFAFAAGRVVAVTEPSSIGRKVLWTA